MTQLPRSTLFPYTTLFRSPPLKHSQTHLTRFGKIANRQKRGAKQDALVTRVSISPGKRSSTNYSHETQLVLTVAAGKNRHRRLLFRHSARIKQPRGSNVMDRSRRLGSATGTIRQGPPLSTEPHRLDGAESG